MFLSLVAYHEVDCYHSHHAIHPRRDAETEGGEELGECEGVHVYLVSNAVMMNTNNSLRINAAVLN